MGELSTILFGLLSALTWGAGDFCGGLSSKRAHAYTVVLVAATVALGVLGGPLVDLATRAAGDLVHPSGYLRAVGGR